MQSDEVVWQIINRGHCSYKMTTDTSTFCRNGYNLTGMCNRSSCPLANSQYATVKEENGSLQLYTKSVERAHTPSKLWERTELSSKYDEALDQISHQLLHWPKFLVHKNKQRLTKLTQLLIRTKRLEKTNRVKIETIPARLAQRESRAERKAQTAARVEKSIESELLNRLSSGVYSSNYTFATTKYAAALNEEESYLKVRSKRQRQIQAHELEYEFEEDKL